MTDYLFDGIVYDMTIRMPKENIADKILKTLGKKRGVKIPDGIFKKFDPQKVDVYVIAQKEGFWKALLRSKDEKLPEDFFNLYDFDKLKGLDDG
ncbi:MAG: hypothetical protein HKO68_06875 [Desulfobacterales bacterium]|nr:hypothetical protein [Desulfobacterales bacterium]